jgi:hypothetical protein
MDIIENITSFKSEIAPLMNLKGYAIQYKFFSEGDFGSLNQAEFNSNRISGNVDFWGRGWLGIFIWDNKTEKELLNVFCEPSQSNAKKKAFDELRTILNNYTTRL